MSKYKTLILFIVGIGLIITGFMLGGDKELRNMIPIDRINKLDISKDNIINIGLKNEYHNLSHEFQNNIEDLDISLKNAVIKIREDDVSYIQMYVENADRSFKIMTDNTLFIKDNDGIVINNETTRIEIIVPYNYRFEDSSIEVGAGRLELDNLCSSTLDINVGAGEVVINNANISKEINIDCGLGNVIIDSEESLKDYDYHINCGLGNIVIGDARYSGISEHKTHHNHDRKIHIDCGIGNVEIKED